MRRNRNLAYMGQRIGNRTLKQRLRAGRQRRSDAR